ncbi:hypothetical protein H072_994 [Dactylellina haptotyla CBS 200.50]|uniref:F-box domain-containing protein n=1 Tax=Dactylellina haptotyla (strain CBS 200.50) TaxID=1284197 RepID=S8AQ84_DACHA|nr:hypothetical protein H072_994 [Dactylellina haptotyla CBS 200.50]
MASHGLGSVLSVSFPACSLHWSFLKSRALRFKTCLRNPICDSDYLLPSLFLISIQAITHHIHYGLVVINSSDPARFRRYQELEVTQLDSQNPTLPNLAQHFLAISPHSHPAQLIEQHRRMPLTSFPPELLLSILAHLTLKDTFSLLQTCKSLYPTAHRHLWSTLHLCDRIPLRYKGPPCPPFVHRPANAIGNDGCRALAEAISEFEDEKLGFSYIRGLVLEPEVFRRSTACMRDGVLNVLGDRIEAGEVPVRWVKVSVWGSFLETSDDPPSGAERFLKILKKYSEGKSADEFSFILDANYIASLSPWYSPKCSLFDLIDMDKLTSLDLQLDLYDNQGYYDDAEGEVISDLDDDEWDAASANSESSEDILETDDDDKDNNNDVRVSGISRTRLKKPKKPIPVSEGTAAKQLIDLTRLLTRTVNLRVLKLATDAEDLDKPYSPPRIHRMAAHLTKLQTAFTNLRKLEWLYLRGLLFHPSFFVVPPTNVRILKVKCIVSVAWWRKFAECPLIGVKEFTVYNRPVERGSWMSPSDQDDYELQEEIDEDGNGWGMPFPFNIGEVMVEGLKEIWAQGGFMPADLIACIVKKNRGGLRILEGMGVPVKDWVPPPPPPPPPIDTIHEESEDVDDFLP